MRKADIKIGMWVAHKETGKVLGEVIDILASVVKFRPYPLNPTIPYGIGGFTEIMPCEAPE